MNSDPRCDITDVGGTQEVSVDLEATSNVCHRTAAYLLIGANILGFLLILGYGAYSNGANTPIVASFNLEALRTLGANYGPDTLGGQYWRLITSLFLHSGIWHFSINMFFLWYLVILLDRIVGWPRAVLLYLVTGTAASMVSLYWHPTSISNGASGSLYGLAGVLISLFIFNGDALSLRDRRHVLFWALLWTPIGLLSQLLCKGVDTATQFRVDTAAHIGGLISGLMIGAFLAPTLPFSAGKRLNPPWRLLGFSLATLIIIFALVIWVRSDVVELHRGELALDRNDPAAIAHIERFVQRNPSDMIGHGELGYTYDHFGQCLKAEGEFRYVLDLDPSNPAAQYDLARIYTYCMNRPGDAVPLFRSSLPHLTESSNRYFYFGAALESTNNLGEAEEVTRKAIALSPKSARNHQLLSVILGKLGKDEEAAAEHKLAEQLRAP
ncbi:MAG: rhomboid family intramembrane serine protease [Candidatus Angelobacter sp.]